MNLGEAMTRVARQGGPGAWLQMFGVLRLLLSGRGFSMDEYYSFGLWRRAEGSALRRELVPGSSIRAYNGALRMPSRGGVKSGIVDKLVTEALLRARNLPTTVTRAAFAGSKSDVAPLPPHVRALRDAGAVAAFLADPGDLPIFGKPRDDSFARGAVAITGVAPDRQSVGFLNGRTAPVAALASEICADWTGGYLFQPFYTCEARLRAHVGPAMASVRICTLLTDRGVEPWYAVLRIPARTAMHDGDAFSTRVWGLIDLADGRILRLRNIKDPATPDVTHWLNPDEPLLGFVMPHWPQAMAAVIAAHESFPGYGVLGWDVFLTDEGALINEVNSNPGLLYQRVATQGMKNPAIAPPYERALAHTKAVNLAAGNV